MPNAIVTAARDRLVDYVLDRAARAPRGTRPAVASPLQGAHRDQGEALAALLYPSAVPTGYTAPRASDSSVRGLPAAGFCRDLIANAGASMMVEAQCFVGDEEVDRPAIVDEPHAIIDAFDFWWQVFASLIMHGNYVALPVDHDAEGWPRQALPVPVDAVTCDETSGLPVYTVAGLRETYDHLDIIHIAAKRPPGSYWGEGVIVQHRRAWQQQLHQQTYQTNSHATAAVPPVVITLDTQKVESTVASTVKADWIASHGDGQRAPAVVPKTMDIKTLAWSPEDSQFIEARQLSIGETAYMFGLQPADIGAVIATGGATMTYENLSTRQLARLIDSYSPWIQRVERSWSKLTPGRIKVRGNPEALQRMSTKERYELRQLAQAIGVETPEESRVLEKRAPIGASEPEPEVDVDDEQVEVEEEEQS